MSEAFLYVKDIAETTEMLQRILGRLGIFN
jgi:hypothetical protein